MLFLSNRFSILEESEQSEQSDDEQEYKSINKIICDKKTFSNKKIIGSVETEISLEFVNSKPIRIKRIKKKYNKKQRAKNETHDLPNSIIEAVELKKNLTLKQILILMNLQAIPGLVLNMIHEKLQKYVKRKQVKISYDSRIFYVSQYNWYDLVQIEIMINKMLDS